MASLQLVSGHFNLCWREEKLYTHLRRPVMKFSKTETDIKLMRCFSLYFLRIVNPSRLNPGRREKNKLNLFSHFFVVPQKVL